MNLTFSAIASFPKTKAGYIDLFELYRLCSKFDVDIELLEELEPWELILILEGKVEKQREYFEFLSYSLYSSIAQLMSKKRKFENPFEKKEMEKHEVPTKEVEARTMEVLADIFNFTNDQIENEE